MKRNPTAVSGSGQEPPAPPPESPPEPRDAGRRTRIIEPERPAPAPAPQRSSDRKITGVLVTFSARPQGQLFAVYEGRNVIGSGTIASEDDRDCDIRIRDDREMSNEHALILCVRGRYQLIDLNSTNGTYLNGAEQPLVRNDLADGATIRTGSTLWLFRTIGASPQPQPDAPAKHAGETPAAHHSPGGTFPGWQQDPG